MNCKDIENLLHAHLDHELDVVTDTAVAEHLSTCASCTRLLEEYSTLNSALRSPELAYTAPPNLDQRISAEMLPAQRETPRVVPGLWRLFGTGAISVACAVLITWGMLRVIPVSQPDILPGLQPDQLTGEIVASHVRSLMVDHLTDVSSSDRHTVKPWFNSKLDFSPKVVDFTGDGYPLVGGRLDYIDGRPVSALVYRHRQHLINVYSWPMAATTQTNLSVSHRQGYNLVSWADTSMQYWLVSDLNARELKAFASLIRNQ